MLDLNTVNKLMYEPSIFIPQYTKKRVNDCTPICKTMYLDRGINFESHVVFFHIQHITK